MGCCVYMLETQRRKCCLLRNQQQKTNGLLFSPSSKRLFMLPSFANPKWKNGYCVLRDYYSLWNDGLFSLSQNKMVIKALEKVFGCKGPLSLTQINSINHVFWIRYSCYSRCSTPWPHHRCCHSSSFSFNHIQAIRCRCSHCKYIYIG